MRNLRLTLLGILCAGLLLGGIGVGVGMAEFSAFTYGGTQLVQGAETRTQTFTLHLERDSGPVRISDRFYYDRSLRTTDVARLETSDTVQQGTLLWELTYETVGPEPTVWQNFDEDADTEWVNLGSRSYSDLQVVLACKDQVLSDIRAGRLGEYVPARITESVITVNPADAARISLGW